MASSQTMEQHPHGSSSGVRMPEYVYLRHGLTHLNMYVDFTTIKHGQRKSMVDTGYVSSILITEEYETTDAQ